MKNKFHFTMICGILDFISFCFDSMRSVLNEKMCLFFFKDGTFLILGPNMESAVFEMFQISTFILLSFQST